MRLVHWISYPETGTSGFFGSASELMEAEIDLLGEPSIYVCDSMSNEKGKEVKLHRHTLKTSSWDVAKDPDSVNIIHTYCAYTLHDMKRRIFLSQGVPEYVWWETLKGESVWWQVTTLVTHCDATVCWFKRDTEFWRLMTDNKVVNLRRGVDLDFWSPGIRKDPGVHPYLLYADALRIMKYPLSLLYATKIVQSAFPYTYLKLILGEPAEYIHWSNLVTELRMQHYVPFIFGLIPKDQLRQTYRDVDVVVSPCYWGLTPRTPIEAMACGTPAVCLEGDDEPIYALRVEDSPQRMAEGIMKLWDRMRDDPEKERMKARGCAEKYWDVKDTVKGILKVCEEVY